MFLPWSGVQQEIQFQTTFTKGRGHVVPKGKLRCHFLEKGEWLLDRQKQQMLAKIILYAFVFLSQYKLILQFVDFSFFNVYFIYKTETLQVHIFALLLLVCTVALAYSDFILTLNILYIWPAC